MQDEDVALSKVSHFIHSKGVISCFLEDQQAIDDVTKSTNDILYSDETTSEKLTSDEEAIEDKFTNTNLDMTRACTGEIEPIGYAESVFREVHGVPETYEFIPNALAKIQLSSPKFNELRENERNCCKLESDTHKMKLVHHSTIAEVGIERCERWSLAKIEKIEGNTIWISGAKIINNTSIFDIKNIWNNEITDEIRTQISENRHVKNIFDKVLKEHDQEASEEISFEAEIKDMLPKDKSITYTAAVLKELGGFVQQGRLDFYNSVEDVTEAIKTVLSMDPLAIETKTKGKKESISAIAFDNLMIIYQSKEKAVKVFKVLWTRHFIETGAEHSQQWLDSIATILNFDRLLS